MRIGTWNLDNKWTERHCDFLSKNPCDVWLFTEVNPSAIADSGHIGDLKCHKSSSQMTFGQHWAAIASSRSFTALPDPHFASAAVVLDGVTFCSSILPWKAGLAYYPGRGNSHADRTADAIEAISQRIPNVPLVWGGDWNHSFRGSEVAGSNEGRQCLRSALAARNLQIPTAELPHRLESCYSIDHIAVPQNWIVGGAERVSAKHLSDHDAYFVDVEIQP